MVNLNTLEAERKKAEEEKEGKIVEAQIEVYENQNYEARNAYADAKAKRETARAKLPEKIPDDRAYKEKLLEAQYAKIEAVTQKQSDQVDDYTAEIKSQQKAKETIQVLDREIPQLYQKAEQEVEAVKQSVYITAKETATKSQDALIQSIATQSKAESERRSAEIKAVNDKYATQKNPYTYRAGSKGASYNNDAWVNWNTSQAKSKQAELNAITYKNVVADGFSPASVNRGGFIPMPSSGTARKLYTGEAINQVTASYLKDNTPSILISNRWTRYQVEITRANQAVYAGGSLQAHASAVQSAKNAFDGLALQEQQSNSAKARTESTNQLKNDKAYWDDAIKTNYSVQTANQKILDSKGLNINVAELDKKGLSTIYNVGSLGETSISNAGGKQLTTVDMMKAGFLPNESTVGITSTVTGVARRADSPVNGMTLDTSPKATPYVSGLTLSPKITGSYNSNPMLNGTLTSKQIDSQDYKSQVGAYTDNVYKQQRVTEIANQRQTAYTNELVAGRVGIATALLNPQTTQSYKGNDTRNLKTYLTSRGFDISNPDTIPDSVFYPTKGVSGKVDSKGMFVIPSQPVISSDVLRERTEARARWESITVPTMPSNPLIAPTPKQKQPSENISAVVKPPTWTFNNQSFTSKDKLDAYVQSRTDQAVANTKANQLLNKKNEFTWDDKKINKTGSLNPEGYIEGFVSPVNDPFKHSLSDVKGTRYGGKSLTDAIDTKQSESDTMLAKAQFNSDKTKLNYIPNITGSLNPEGYIKGFVAPTAYTRYDDPAPTPQWTVGGKTFTSKSDLTDYIRTGKDATFKEAKLNNDKNKLLNEKSNITGSLNYTDSILGLKSATSNSITESSNTNPTVSKWNVDGKTFTSKSEFTKYVKSQSDSVFAQAKLNTDKNKLLNETSNITGSLNPAPETKNSLLKTSTSNPTVPQWSADGITFTSKSEFTKYVKSGKDEILKQAQVITNKTKLNYIPNITGSLNPVGFIKPTTTVLDVPSKTSGVTTAPTFTFNNKTFESKDELDTFVKSSSATKLEQAKSGITNPINSLLADGYTTKVKDAMFANTPTGDSRYNNTGYKPDAKPVTDASKVLPITASTDIPSNYSGDIWSVPNPITGVTKEFRTKERADKYAIKVTKQMNMIPDPNNPLPPKPQWTVMSNTTENITIPKMGGGGFNAIAQKYETFDSLAEAEAYSKFQKDSSQKFQMMFNGEENNLQTYSYNVRAGLIPEPTSLQDHVKLKISQFQEPFTNIGSSINNMAGGKQMNYVETAEEKFFSGTIDDVVSGNPFKGTGASGAWEEIVKDPSRFAVQVPASLVAFRYGGKAIEAGVTGVNMLKGGLAGASFIPKPIKAIGTKIESGVNTVQGLPKQAGLAVGSQVWKITPAQIQAGLKSVDKSLAYVGGQRVGVGTAMNLRYTLGGRKFLKESLATSSKENAMPKKTAQQFIDDPLTSVNTKENPINIVSKNVIEVPIKKSDESIIHTRNIDFDSPTVKVGNVQEYYKTATNSFTNVPKHGLQFPKAPKLPSLDSARRWVAKTKQNVKRVEQGGYKAMSSGGNTKFKIAEKSQKAKDTILDTKQIMKDEINYAKEDLSLLSKQKMIKYSDDSKQMKSEVTESVKKTLVDTTSKAKMIDNAWNKLSQMKAETRVKMGEMKKSITDRPATDELILYRETTETTATKSLAKSTTEPLTIFNPRTGKTIISGSPIKTSTIQTKTPTDFTTKKVSKQFVEGEETLYPKGWKQAVPPKKPELVYENVEGSLHLLQRVNPNLQIVGEQVRIPFKDHKTIQSFDKSNLDRMYQRGTYKVLEKGKLVERKVEVKALQQEDVDKTFQKRNSQMASVTEWGGTRKKEMLDMNEKKVTVDVEVGGQKSDTSFRYALNYKVLTTKLSPLPKKKTSTVQYRQTTQDDSGSVFTAESITGNPTTGSTGGYGKIKPEGTGTYDPRTGTTTIPKINAVSSPIKGKAKLVMKEYSSTLKSTKSPYNSAYTGGAIGEVTFTSSILTPKGMIKTGVDTNSASITGVQGKIDTKVETGLKQDSVQKLNTDTTSRLNTRSKIRSKMNIKLDTGLKTTQMTTATQIPLLKTPIYSRQQTPKVLPIILSREALNAKKTSGGKRGKKAGFIGNVRLDNIMGMYKRKEITYGQSKVTRLERQDGRLTSGTPNRIAQPSSKLLKTKKKKQNKTETIFGRTVTKTKDEFSGFGSKKKSSLFG